MMRVALKYRKRIGTNYEVRFISRLIRIGEAVKAGRFYSSKGVTDVWWVDKEGRHHEAQLKFSTYQIPIISKEELWKLREFANKYEKQITTWLVKKQSRGREIREKITL